MPPDKSSKQGLWRAAATILILALAPAIGVGIARFAYSLLLPDMRASLGWSYAAAGFNECHQRRRLSDRRAHCRRCHATDRTLRGDFLWLARLRGSACALRHHSRFPAAECGAACCGYRRGHRFCRWRRRSGTAVAAISHEPGLTLP